MSWLVVLCVGCLVLPGCGGAMTRANYEKIQEGKTTLSEAEGLMGGKPVEVAADQFSKLIGAGADAVSQLSGGKDAGAAFKGAGDLMGNAMGAALNFVGVKYYRWGDESKYVLVLVAGDKIQKKWEKGL
jgi:hypothetical protein